jgi:hypothetical protein
MKTHKLLKWLILILAGTMCLPLLAATNVVAPPAPSSPGTGISSADLWNTAISLVSPVVIWLLNKLAPKIPKPLLPTLTPVVGVGLGVLVNWLAGEHFTWFQAAKAGALAVFVREVVNQWVTKQMGQGQDTPPPP